MLNTLRIRDLAVIDDLTIEFGPGLNLLTGETGAGKSILIDALGLAVGDRADADRVRGGSERAVVEAAFQIGRDSGLAGLLEARGIDATEDLVIRREVPVGGSGRVFINGSLATVSVLREIGDRLVELHGQHEHQSLLSPERHLELLDVYGGHLEEVSRVERAFHSVLATRAEAERLRGLSERTNARIQELEAVVREIDAADPRPGESEDLDRERRLLQNSARVAGLLEELVALLHDGEPSATSLAATAARRASELARIDPGLQEVADRIEASRLELQDAGAIFRDVRERTDFEPGRLEAIEARRALLERLRQRYGEDEAAVRNTRDEAGRELALLKSLDEGIERADLAQRHAEADYRDAALRLSSARRQAGLRLGPEVESQLRSLALVRARFEVSFAKARGSADEAIPLTPRGAERVEFLLAANPGEPPRALQKVASGGELSRIMLALHVVLEGAGTGRVLVFDEVDAGVGGRVADIVGSRLARLAARHQVLCVTHLPQVAAHADRHYHVRKRVLEGRARAEAVELTAEERVDELARMLGGREVTDASRKNAAELLAAAAGGAARRSRRRG